MEKAEHTLLRQIVLLLVGISINVVGISWY